MRRIVVDRAARMVAGALQKHLEGGAVEHVFAGVDFIAEVDAGFVIGVEDRPPAPRQFVERGLDQARRPLRPWIQEWPRQRAGEADAAGQAKPARRLRRLLHLIHGPGLPLRGLTLHRRWRERVESFIIGRMYGDELSLQMGRQFGDGEPVLLGDAGDLVAIGLRRCRLVEIDHARIEGRDLHALVAEAGGPAANGIKAVERRGVAGELGEEYRRSLHGGGHFCSSFQSRRRRLQAANRSVVGQQMHLIFDGR